MNIVVPSIVPPEPEVNDRPDRPHIGHAVKDGKIRFLSVSQVVVFDARYEGGCPRRWAFQKLFGKKEAKTDAQKRGNIYSKEGEHYLKTGEDTLSPIMRAGKHFLPRPGPDLEVEKDMGDPLKAIELRDQLIKTPNAEALKRALKSVAPLTAVDIPFIGAPDFRHRRGEYIDENGILQREALGHVVCETGDHKSTSRINDHVTSGGKVIRGYAKTLEEILWHPQMLGYGESSTNEFPDLTHVRLSHIYYQTKNGYTATKRTGLLTVHEVRHRWRARVEPTVREMIDVAMATKPDDVPCNTGSCRAFNKDCPHLSYCNRPAGSIIDLFQGAASMATPGLFDMNPTNGVQQGTVSVPAPTPTPAAPVPQGAPAVGLFSPSVATAPPPPPPPQMTDAERQAAIEAERKRLQAEDAGLSGRVPLQGVPGYTVGQPCNGRGYYVSKDGQAFIAVEAGHKCPACTQPAQTVPHIGAVNPLDKPPIDHVASADPLPQEEIAKITDPALHSLAQAHADGHAQRTQAATAAAPAQAKKGGRCPGSGKQLPITQLEARNRKKVCLDCGQERRVKDTEFSPDFTMWLVPNHNLPKTDAAAPAPPAAPASAATPAAPAPPAPPAPPAAPVGAAPPPPPAPPAAYVAPGALPTQTAMPAIVAPPPPPAPAAPPAPTLMQQTMQQAMQVAAALLPQPPPAVSGTGITLYIDTICERGPQPQSLELWIDDLVKTLTETSGLRDLRWAPDKHELAFARWKGALAATVRANPLRPGVYMISGIGVSEIKQVVVEALAPSCDVIVRGLR